MTTTALRLIPDQPVSDPAPELTEAVWVVRDLLATQDWSTLEDDRLSEVLGLVTDLQRAGGVLRTRALLQARSRALARHRSAPTSVRMIDSAAPVRDSGAREGSAARAGRPGHRSGFLSILADGDRVRLRGCGPTADGAVIRAALLRCGTTSPHASPEASAGCAAEVRDLGMLLWDSLVRLAEESLDRRSSLPGRQDQSAWESATAAPGVGGDHGGAEQGQ